jgi:hypothetical protein
MVFLVHTFAGLVQELFAKLEEDQNLLPGMRVTVSYLRKCRSQSCQVIGMMPLLTFFIDHYHLTSVGLFHYPGDFVPRPSPTTKGRHVVKKPD